MMCRKQVIFLRVMIFKDLALPNRLKLNHAQKRSWKPAGSVKLHFIYIFHKTSRSVLYLTKKYITVTVHSTREIVAAINHYLKALSITPIVCIQTFFSAGHLKS